MLDDLSLHLDPSGCGETAETLFFAKTVPLKGLNVLPEFFSRLVEGEIIEIDSL